MMKALKRLLTGPLPTADALEKASTSIDLHSLEVALADAQRKRAGILLDGTTDQILAAEREIDEARIALERAKIALAELERRKTEADAKATRDALEQRRARIQRKVEEATSRIEAEYPAAASKIAELASLAKDADAEAQAWLLEVMDDRTDGLPVVDFVATHLGWPDEFFIHPDFAKAPVLPPVGDFNGFNDGETFVTHVRHYAVAGAGTGGELVRKQQERGPRWERI